MKVHRSLGVHLSFVRSVTMDKWKDLEIEKMRCGGNDKLNEFLESKPDYRQGWSIQEKYNTKSAALYRDKISTEAKGGKWNEATSSAQSYKPHIPVAGTAQYGGGGGGQASGAGGFGGGGLGGGGSDGEAAFGNGMSVDAMKKSTGAYFAKMQASNNSRPDGVKPSEGGKYAGFGSGGKAMVIVYFRSHPVRILDVASWLSRVSSWNGGSFRSCLTRSDTRAQC